MIATESNPAASPQPIIQTIYVGGLSCHLCGTTAGAIESDRYPLPATVRFKPTDRSEAITVLNWRRLRCGRCSGVLFVEDFEAVRRRIEPANVFDEDRPRRGRPPKWLVEKRQRERELLEQQIAQEAA